MNIFIQNKFELSLFVKTDLTLCRDNSDFYIPESFQSIIIEPAIAVKINRAGKYISSQFAHRYYSEVNIALNIVSDNFYSDKIKVTEYYLNSVMEQSFYFIDIKNISELSKGFVINMEADNDIITSPSYTDPNIIVDYAIEEISRVTSLKSGDIIAVTSEVNLKSQKGSNLRVYLDSLDNNYIKLLDFLIR